MSGLRAKATTATLVPRLIISLRVHFRNFGVSLLLRRDAQAACNQKVTQQGTPLMSYASSLLMPTAVTAGRRQSGVTGHLARVFETMWVIQTAKHSQSHQGTVARYLSSATLPSGQRLCSSTTMASKQRSSLSKACQISR